MAKRSADKWYKIIAKSIQPFVCYDPSTRIIAVGGAIAVRAEKLACQEMLMLMGLMDFREDLRGECIKDDLTDLFAVKKVGCQLSPYFVKVGDNIMQLAMCKETKKIAAYKYDYTKLICQGDIVYMTDEEYPRLFIYMADEDDEWDKTEIIIAPLTLAELPEISPLKSLLPTWTIV